MSPLLNGVADAVPAALSAHREPARAAVYNAPLPWGLPLWRRQRAWRRRRQHQGQQKLQQRRRRQQLARNWLTPSRSRQAACRAAEPRSSGSRPRRQASGEPRWVHQPGVARSSSSSAVPRWVGQKAHFSLGMQAECSLALAGAHCYYLPRPGAATPSAGGSGRRNHLPAALELCVAAERGRRVQPGCDWHDAEGGAHDRSRSGARTVGCGPASP